MTQTLTDERDFFMARALHGDSTWVGRSSDAMLRQTLMGTEYPDDYPRDDADLARCEETYRRAPAHLQERMLPTLELFRRMVKDGGLWCYQCDHGRQRGTWSDLCKTHAAEAGIDTRPWWERES